MGRGGCSRRAREGLTLCSACSFLIGEDGRVYEGRGWRTKGAHTKLFNSRSLGLAFLGTFSSKWVSSIGISPARP